MSKIYAVASGRSTGIFNTWDECQKQVSGFKGSVFKSFTSLDEAIDFLKTNGVDTSSLTSKPEKNITVHRDNSSNGGIYKVYTDGGCQVNPGGRGAYGCVIIAPDGEEIRLSEGYISSTNNRMEIMGVIAALKAIENPSQIELYSDSQYVIKTMKGEFSKGKNIDLWELLDEQVKRHLNIKWIWVRGHNGNKYNEICDQLATKAMSGDDLKIDLGYQGEVVPFKPRININKSSAMNIPITAQEETYPLSNESAEEEANRRGCCERCIDSIRQFYKVQNHSFKDYAQLKTYGKDVLSAARTDDELKILIGEDIYEVLKEHIEDDKERKSAARWIARGLLIHDAIRKVYVDKEIAQNAIQNRDL